MIVLVAVAMAMRLAHMEVVMWSIRAPMLTRTASSFAGLTDSLGEGHKQHFQLPYGRERCYHQCVALQSHSQHLANAY